MNRLSSSKALVLIIAILLVTNISMLVYFLNRKEAPEREPRKRYDMAAFFKNDLKFSEQQLAILDSAKQKHRDSIGRYFKSLNESKQAFFNLLSSPKIDTLMYDSLAMRVAMKQAEVEKAFFRHFRDLRTICTPEQQVRYDSLFPNEIRKMISGRRKKQD